jgi:hypothetical protein
MLEKLRYSNRLIRDITRLFIAGIVLVFVLSSTWACSVAQNVFGNSLSGNTYYARGTVTEAALFNGEPIVSLEFDGSSGVNITTCSWVTPTVHDSYTIDGCRYYHSKYTSYSLDGNLVLRTEGSAITETHEESYSFVESGQYVGVIIIDGCEYSSQY